MRTPLIYQAEPIQPLLQDSDLVAPESYELLWRGPECAKGGYPDEHLIRALGSPQIDGVLHLNLSGPRMLSIPDELIAAAAHHHRLVLEWTEHQELQALNPRMIQLIGARIARWRDDYGVQVAVDDWDGSEDSRSRFEAVHDGPDLLKVDGPCFRRAVSGDERMLLKVGRFLERAAQERPGLVRVVEWVERREELAVAKQMNADAAQGYLFQPHRVHLVPFYQRKLIQEVTNE